MRKKIQIAGLVAALTLVFTGISQAHGHRDRDDSGNYAYHRGYRDGFDHGRMDLSRGVTYNYQSEDYEDADHGYNPDFGSREEYRGEYRDGYVAGYNDAYYGRSGRFEANEGPRYYQNGNIATQVGYQDGLIDGEKDQRANKRFRPDKHERYEDADHGYRHDFGNKQLYKQEYRQAYANGYQDGYRGYQRP